LVRVRERLTNRTGCIQALLINGMKRLLEQARGRGRKFGFNAYQ
jgi:hypothetical protein